MIEKINRYWKAFSILVRYREHALDVTDNKKFYGTVEFLCIERVEQEKYDEENRGYLQNRKNRQFANQNYLEVKAGLWNERINWFYSQQGEETGLDNGIFAPRP